MTPDPIKLFEQTLPAPLRQRIDDDEIVPILPALLDSTMLTCFRSCPRKFFLEFCYGFRPQTKSVDLHAGACFATALEVVYKLVWVERLSLSEALQKAQAHFLVAWGDFQIPEYKKTYKTWDRVWVAVEEYFKEWPPLTDPVQPYIAADGTPTFEFTFSIPLEPADNQDDDGMSFPLHPSGEPFLYGGRFDKLGRYREKPVVCDEKTQGGSISTGWVERFNLRSQFIGYTWACRTLGIEDLDTVVVRGIAIQKTQIPLAEAIKPYSNFIRAKWHEQLRRDVWRIRRMWDEGYWDYNLGDSCSDYGGCVFMPVCESHQPEVEYSNYAVRRWNPLLKNPVVLEAVA